MVSVDSISISDVFDGGNIKLVESVSDGQGQHRIHLRIEGDTFTELEKTRHCQYFSFRSTLNELETGESKTITFVIENAYDVSYPVAWKGTTVFYTDNMADTNSWLRKLDTQYDGGKLIWTHTFTQTGSVYHSFFPPYTSYQHLELIAKCQNTAAAEVRSLCQTLQGRELECISFGDGDRVCWIIHRQHPGEPMAEYYAEGLLTRLLGLETDGNVDESVRKVLSLYKFYIVPCMCPDGAALGYLRTNSVGANLNREWCDSADGNYKAPSLERSPEVLAVLNEMDKTGVDFFMDVHGDEELPFNFFAGPILTKNWGERLKALHGAFLGAYVRASSDMQKEVGYEPPADESEVEPNIAINAVANRYNCLAATLEMPFKDCLTNPDPERGWSPERSRKLGASVIEALIYIHPYLRGESEFWKSLPEDDAYVTPSPKYE